DVLTAHVRVDADAVLLGERAPRLDARAAARAGRRAGRAAARTRVGEPGRRGPGPAAHRAVAPPPCVAADPLRDPGGPRRVAPARRPPVPGPVTPTASGPGSPRPSPSSCCHAWSPIRFATSAGTSESGPYATPSTCTKVFSRRPTSDHLRLERQVRLAHDGHT